MLGISGKHSEPHVSPWNPDVSPCSACVQFPPFSSVRSEKCSAQLLCFGSRCDRRGMCQVPLILQRKVFRQWRPAARAHVHRPLGGLIEGMISRRGAMISLPSHAQNRFAGVGGGRKGRREKRSLEMPHSKVWPVDSLDYFEHTNQSRRYCTLQAQAAEQRLEIRGVWKRGLSCSTEGNSS